MRFRILFDAAPEEEIKGGVFHCEDKLGSHYLPCRRSLDLFVPVASRLFTLPILS